ncbi:putative Calnexin like protein [Blattamonas nauphoetae]|uniref:Calnexin like protein n=1 Tax=Blattamonas nauphoetae TaxID=2049346 RepID=A0ABQ9YA21_9EUKA|nr:putative Calnexin like protein [Blattamonas nauphoetae]
MLVLSFFSLIRGAIYFSDRFQNQVIGDYWRRSHSSEYNATWAIEQRMHASPKDHDFGVVSKSSNTIGAVSCPANFTHDRGMFILQFVLQAQRQPWSCGSVFVKLLNDDFSPMHLNSTTQYKLMFGAEKCKHTNKLYFYYGMANNKTQKYTYHKLINAAKPNLDSKSHFYRLILLPNNEYRLWIDNKVEQQGSLLQQMHFIPPIQPPEMVPDFKAKKPDDWDQPYEIPDPDITKPLDWDDEEFIIDEDYTDGRMKKNPNYQGQWKQPLMANPKYKGAWRQPLIPNDEYYTVKHPYKLGQITGVAIEVNSSISGAFITNLFMTDNLTYAESERERWKATALAEEKEEQRLKLIDKNKRRREKLSQLDGKSFKQKMSIIGDVTLTLIGDYPVRFSVTILSVTIVFLGSIGLCLLKCDSKPKETEEDKEIMRMVEEQLKRRKEEEEREEQERKEELERKKQERLEEIRRRNEKEQIEQLKRQREALLREKERREKEAGHDKVD